MIYHLECFLFPGAVNGRGANDGGTHNFPGYVPITTQGNVVPGVLTKVTFPNGVPPPPPPFFEFPDQTEFPPAYHF